MNFTTPLALLLLLTLPYFFWLGRPQRAANGRYRTRNWREWVSLGLRILIMLLLVLSLAGSHLVRGADELAAGNTDPGAPALLERYADWRRADHRKLVGFTDGLVRLFGSRRTPLRTLRNVGMLGFDLLPGVRRLFARHTMGLAGRLPRLSRGVPLT